MFCKKKIADDLLDTESHSVVQGDKKSYKQA
jgi:hypothetical protein